MLEVVRLLLFPALMAFAAASDLLNMTISNRISLALVAGFAVLALSPVPTVRDFGIWSAFDLLLATAAVLVLLPPLARRWYA